MTAEGERATADGESSRQPSHLVVGHLNKPHGTKGEIFVWPLTDYPASHFAPGVVHLPGDEEGREPADSLPPLVIESVRPYRKGFLAKFAGVGDRDGAERLRGLYLFRPFDAIDPLADDEIFYHQLLGAEVATLDDVSVGRVTEVFPLKPADLLQVAGRDGGEVLVPMAPEIVVKVDRERRRVLIDPPEGLLP